LFHAGGRADKHDEANIAFRNFANAPKHNTHNRSYDRTDVTHYILFNADISVYTWHGKCHNVSFIRQPLLLWVTISEKALPYILSYAVAIITTITIIIIIIIIIIVIFKWTEKQMWYQWLELSQNHSEYTWATYQKCTKSKSRSYRKQPYWAQQ
jgi:uncharacterized membrane protein